MARPKRFVSKHFYLNESHELPPNEKGGGGNVPQFVGVDWERKGKRLANSLAEVEQVFKRSLDPGVRSRYYVVANPIKEIVKVSEAKKAKENKLVSTVDFSGEQSRIFGRLGLDLIDVFPNGSALVHAIPQRIEQLKNGASQLSNLTQREQARWISLDEFSLLQGEFKFDNEWLLEIAKRPAETYIALQPFLTPVEADAVFRSISQGLKKKSGEELRGAGQSYLGRYWLKALLTSPTIKSIANEFLSVRYLHPPILSSPSAVVYNINTPTAKSPRQTRSPLNINSLPCVGVLDTGIPENHLQLSKFRRGRRVVGRDCINGHADNHGSQVASRIVFGDIDEPENIDAGIHGECRFFDITVANSNGAILTQSVVGALATAISAAPDIRVFNLSFDLSVPLHLMPTVHRGTALNILEELDNFAFDNDIILVIAAGNSPGGLIPQEDYPNHIDDANWSIGLLPRSFNAMTCGGTICRLSAEGIASETNAPSPFSKIGPGFADSPKPDFCATAGNLDSNYEPSDDMGVWVLDAAGSSRNIVGTSYAAPILAREAAFVLESLKKVCPVETVPFACTVKAILAATAFDVSETLTESLKPLAKRALGRGKASSERLNFPITENAMFIWQGSIEHPSDIVRVQLPLPSKWVNSANEPQLKIVLAWDTPVSSATEHFWSCRDVTMTLRKSESDKAAIGSRGKKIGYPLYEKHWNLKSLQDKFDFGGDVWTIEIKYEQLTPYAAGHNVSPIQRVAFVGIITDLGENKVSPQEYVQELPITSTMTRFSAAAISYKQPLAVPASF